MSECSAVFAESIFSAFAGTGADVQLLRGLHAFVVTVVDKESSGCALAEFYIHLSADHWPYTASESRLLTLKQTLDVQPNTRLNFLHRLASCALTRLKGNSSDTLACLRELATLCGGHCAGLFSSHRVDGRKLLLPLNLEGAWWLDHYVSVLLLIGDQQAMDGRPQKYAPLPSC